MGWANAVWPGRKIICSWIYYNYSKGACKLEKRAGVSMNWAPYVKLPQPSGAQNIKNLLFTVFGFWVYWVFVCLSKWVFCSVCHVIKSDLRVELLFLLKPQKLNNQCNESNNQKPYVFIKQRIKYLTCHLLSVWNMKLQRVLFQMCLCPSVTGSQNLLIYGHVNQSPKEICYSISICTVSITPAKYYQAEKKDQIFPLCWVCRCHCFFQ